VDVLAWIQVKAEALVSLVEFQTEAKNAPCYPHLVRWGANTVMFVTMTA